MKKQERIESDSRKKVLKDDRYSDRKIKSRKPDLKRFKKEEENEKKADSCGYAVNRGMLSDARRV